MTVPRATVLRRGGLAVRLMGVFALLAVTPTLVLGSLAISRARKDVRREVVRGNLALVRSIGQQFHNTLQDTRRAASVAASALANRPSAEAGQRLVRGLKAEFAILRAVSFLDRNRRLVLGDPLVPAVRGALDLAGNYGGYVSEVIRAAGEKVVILVVQGRDRRGALVGYLTAVVDLAFVQARLSEARLGTGAALLVVDGNGLPVAATGALPAVAPGVSLRGGNPAVDRVLATHKEGHLEWDDADGQPWIGVYRNIAGMSAFRGVRWGVLLLQPSHEAFALARKATRDTLAVALAVLLAAMLVAVFLARWITRPLSALVRQTELVAAESFEARFVPPQRRDEVGDLARAFARMVERLRSSRDKLYALTELRENLFRSIPVGVIAVDRDGRVTSINPWQEALSGVRADDVVGRALPEAFPQREGDAPVAARLSDVLAGGEAVDLTLDHQRTPFTREPRLRYRLRMAHLHDRAGEVDGAVILQEDLSERAQLEAQLIRSEKLSSVGVLAAGVAHEINNPLTTILGYAKLLLEGRDEDDPDHAALELVADEARRVQEIVRNLLDFSRQEPGAVGPTSLSELLERTLSLVAPDLRKRGVAVVRELCADLPMVMADGRRMEQVLVNLITNAAHAMEGGGTLTVRTGERPDARPGMAYAEVADTGHGMDAETQRRIFDPFFTTKETGKGTGLGLSVSHGIVTDHNGEIEVHSEPGAGTTFRVWLQACGGEAQDCSVSRALARGSPRHREAPARLER